MKKIDTAVILAGGKNTRLPVLKGFLKIDNSTIIQKNIDNLKNIFRKIFISTNNPEHYFKFGLQLIGDVFQSNGPMAGIYSSLINIQGDAIFVIACDMPFLNKDLIIFICEQYETQAKIKSIEAVVPIYNKQIQPLFAIYSKKCLSRMEQGIKQDKTNLKKFLKNEVNCFFIDASKIKKIDKFGKSFININTIKDYKHYIGGNI